MTQRPAMLAVLVALVLVAVLLSVAVMGKDRRHCYWAITTNSRSGFEEVPCP